MILQEIESSKQAISTLTEDKFKSLKHVEMTSIEYISKIKRNYHIENRVVKYVVGKSGYNLGVFSAYIYEGTYTVRRGEKWVQYGLS